MQERWNGVDEALSEFSRFLAHDFPKLELQHLYDFEMTDEEYQLSRKAKSAIYNLPGVYLFYDKSGSLLYIGKASWTFDKRVWKHPEIVDAKYIDVIPFDWATSSFCMALEYFLISKLRPNYNKHGRDYDYPE